MSFENLPQVRQENQFQERPAFFDETVLDQDKGDLRREPSPEEKEAMDYKLKKLGQIMHGSNVRWQLDGALNISLMKGEYIGLHKDVDLTIDPVDLENLEEHIFHYGYGLFLSTHDPDVQDKRKMEWVPAEKFRNAPEDHLMIAAVDENGQIKQDEEFNFLDVHLTKRDEQGNPLGYGQVTLPSEWYEPQPVEFQGQQIMLSHPAKVLYFKLHGNRGFDMTDILALIDTGKLGEADIAQIETLLAQEVSNREASGKAVIDEVLHGVSAGQTAEEVKAAFVNHPAVQKSIEAPGAMESLENLVRRIVEETDYSVDQVAPLAFEVFNITEEHQTMMTKIEKIKEYLDSQV